jgi:hypothetical protein
MIPIGELSEYAKSGSPAAVKGIARYETNPEAARLFKVSLVFRICLIRQNCLPIDRGLCSQRYDHSLSALKGQIC